jgi:membrane protease YdiL (CAAX protease family)
MTADRQPTDRDSRAAVLYAGCLYVLLLAGAFSWLWVRDRLSQVHEQALGEHGLWAGAGAGLAVGLGGAFLIAWAARSFAALAAMERRIAAILGPMAEPQVLTLALCSAVAEEMFFRLAVQDAIGLVGAVACYALMNTGPGFWAFLPVAVVSGLAFGLLVQNGLGLLSATTAHALINYFSLRRILLP